jgi:hypothetical protein
MMSPNDALALEIALHLQEQDPSVRLVFWAEADDWGMLPTIGKSGFTFEVGAVSTGCCDDATFQQSLRLIKVVLDYIDKRNAALDVHKETAVQVPVQVHRRLASVGYPRTVDGELDGLIINTFQGTDFTVLMPGTPIFRKFDNSIVCYDPARRSFLSTSQHPLATNDQLRSSTALFPLYQPTPPSDQ